MPLQSVDRKQSRLDNLFSKVGGITDLALQAEFAQYLCVHVSRFVEQSVEDILIAHAKRQSAPTVVNYVDGTVRRTNLNAERLLQVVGHFDGSWRKDLEAYMKGERKDALDSVVNHRNNIVHGEGTTISYQRIANYYASIKSILRRLDDLCLS